MKTNNFFYYIIPIIIMFSCSDNRKQKKYFMKIIENEELQTTLLFSLKEDSISSIQFNILQSFYTEQKSIFKYNSFSDLLNNLDNLTYKEKQSLSFGTSYLLKKNILFIENLSFKEKIKYLNLAKNSKNNYIISSSKYSKEELYTILYIFYKNGNYILYDDEIGQYLIIDTYRLIN